MSADVVVRPWTRYGHDRLYVSSGGVTLGYWDNKTRTLHADDPAGSQALEQALEAYWACADRARDTHRARDTTATAKPMTRPRPCSAPGVDGWTPVAEVPEDTAVSVADVAIPAPERPWTDLALNPPGGAARERAIAAREAAPVKTALARIIGKHTDERSWRIGADGEAAVAARLAKLPETWRVLHAIPIGERGSDIDHVVIGPGGVYTINTKHHPNAKVWVGGNTFLVNGHRQPYIRNSRYEAARASKILSALAGYPVFVTGLIAVLGAQNGFTVRTQPPGADVFIVTRKAITEWLLRRGPVLAPHHIDTLFQIARRSTTWHS